MDNQIQKRIISFVDILGFKNILKEKENIENISRLLRNIRKKNSNYELKLISKDNGTYADYIPDFISFSDHMIISYPFSTNPKQHYQEYNVYLNYLANTINGLQIDALMQGFLLRGAIAIGDIYYEEAENIIFGDKLNEAIEDEMRLAIYPRVIASKSIIEFIKTHNLPPTHFTLDCDGIYYFDYVSTIQHAIDEEQLSECKKIIETNLNRADSLNPRTKWAWLATRFNQIYGERIGKLHINN